jgi:hypothetical protein
MHNTFTNIRHKRALSVAMVLVSVAQNRLDRGQNAKGDSDLSAGLVDQQPQAVFL